MSGCRATLRAAIHEETGIKPHWSAEAVKDLEADVWQPIAWIKASPFIPKKDPSGGSSSTWRLAS